MLQLARVLIVACASYMRHETTGKFLPDDFNVTEIDERTTWEDTRPFITCGVCRMIVAHAYDRLDVLTADDESLHAFLEGACEAPDAQLFHRYQIARAHAGSWDVIPSSEPDDRRTDIRKWQALSMRDTCTFAIAPNDEAIVSALRRCHDDTQRVPCVCAATPLCQSKREPKVA
ncbi:hypothetical protein KFE25_006376 [Diacronema lutheri]|uniref:Uncharacterized protein n=1 Tax=Diacronema lutheri TaxID=2081491 RepID=A0A8J5XVS1_DIALT|nr:hypothetical protein KFE25_006376 [Diacronema lutheri]